MASRSRLERAVVICRRFPRHALRAGNMAAAQDAFLRILGHVRDFAAVLARGAHVDQRFAAFALRQRFIEEGANFLVESFLGTG